MGYRPGARGESAAQKLQRLARPHPHFIVQVIVVLREVGCRPEDNTISSTYTDTDVGTTHTGQEWRDKVARAGGSKINLN